MRALSDLSRRGIRRPAPAPLNSAGTGGPSRLGITEPRAWRTWQVACFCLGSIIVGMAINAPLKGRSAGASSSSLPTLPPLAPATTRPAGAGTSTTSAPKPSTLTTPSSAAPATSAPTPAPTGPPGFLLRLQTQSGPKQSDHFKVASGGWQLGYAFDCQSAGGAGSFHIDIRRADGSPSDDPAVEVSGPSGKATLDEKSSGELYLTVTTPCLWALNVVGASY